MNNKFISEKELLEFGKINNLSEKAEALLKHQKENWDLVDRNFSALKNIETKKYDFGKFFINIQFNPSRILSTSAKVDKKTIEKRVCFLCSNNLPEVQKGINYKDKYTILCNPYPVFKQHLTIPHKKHTPQLIESYFIDMLDLSFDLKDNFFVFYNGAKCGASAPDHLHFQAGLKNSTPLEFYYKEILNQYGEKIKSDNLTEITIVKDFMLKFIYLTNTDSQQITSDFNLVVEKLKLIHKKNEEPMLNILSFYSEDKWHVFVIPRKIHRPEQYFLEGEARILISPASVDLAGLFITPRKEDFDKLKNEDLENILSQVVYENSFFNLLKTMFS